MIDPFIDQMNRAIVTIDSMNVVCARRGDRLRLNEEPRFFLLDLSIGKERASH